MSVPTAQDILRAHTLFGQLTGQRVSLGFERERNWFELLRAGYTLEEVRQVVRYLQGEIRHGRRNVGSLKLSNFLQLDRFEEDLNISRVRLNAQPHPPSPRPQPPPLTQAQQRAGRERALKLLHNLRQRHDL